MLGGIPKRANRGENRAKGESARVGHGLGTPWARVKSLIHKDFHRTVPTFAPKSSAPMYARICSPGAPPPKKGRAYTSTLFWARWARSPFLYIYLSKKNSNSRHLRACPDRAQSVSHPVSQTRAHFSDTPGDAKRARAEQAPTSPAKCAQKALLDQSTYRAALVETRR